MVIPALAAFADEVQLPTDSVELARQSHHVVVLSQRAGQVFRIGLASRPALIDPCDVSLSHTLAVLMSKAGLNVLAPVTPEPVRRGRYILSSFPIAEPLALTGWRFPEPALLGAAMADWAFFRSEILQPLDIPTYTAERLNCADLAADKTLRAGANWCRSQHDWLTIHYPWAQLAAVEGCIHGDPNLGNLVRLDSTPTPQFIDLDSVKRGPRWYDLAAMQTYAIRLAPNYPADSIISGYERRVGAVDIDTLQGLRCWREFSSATQLLTRWTTHGIAEEFWRRTKLHATEPWINVTGTIVQRKGLS